MKPFSIQKKLSQRVTLLTGLVFLLVTIVADIIITGFLVHEFDESLEEKSALFVTLTKDNPHGLDFDFADEFMPEFEASDNSEYFQLWLSDGSVFERSHSLKNADLEYLNLRQPAEQIKDIILPDGRQGRMIQVVFLPQIPEDEDRTAEKLANQTLVTLAIAKQRESLNQLTIIVHFTLIIGTILVLILIYFIAQHTVRAGLKPLLTLKQQIMLLNADNLTCPLRLENPPAELQEVINQFNQLLNRLDHSFSREKRFSADVAHELRTPVAEIRTLSEVALKWPDDINLTRDFYQDVLDSSLQMQQLITNLLSLSRNDSGLFVLEPVEFNLHQLIIDCWQHVKPEADNKQLSFNCNIPDSFVIMSSKTEFTLIINNLFSNAVSYSVNGTEISIKTVEKDQQTGLEISNITDNLQTDDIPHMFDRLWRKSKSRTSSLHSGLGLSLVKSYAELLQLSVSAELINDERFVIRLENLVKV